MHVAKNNKCRKNRVHNEVYDDAVQAGTGRGQPGQCATHPSAQWNGTAHRPGSVSSDFGSLPHETRPKRRKRTTSRDSQRSSRVSVIQHNSFHTSILIKLIGWLKFCCLWDV